MGLIFVLSCTTSKKQTVPHPPESVPRFQTEAIETLYNKPKKGYTYKDAFDLKENIYKKFMPTQELINHLYLELSAIHTLFTKHNIPYSLVSGSYLGAIRNGGPIPNDDDGDIAVLKEDEAQIRALNDEFKEWGLELQDGSYGLMLRPIHDSGKGGDTDLYVFELTEKNGASYYQHAVKSARDSWPKEFFYPEDWNSRIDGKFGPVPVQMFNLKTAEWYLLNLYGENCLTHTKKFWDHVEGKSAQNDYVLLSDSQLFHTLPNIPLKP